MSFLARIRDACTRVRLGAALVIIVVSGTVIAWRAMYAQVAPPTTSDWARSLSIVRISTALPMSDVIDWRRPLPARDHRLQTAHTRLVDAAGQGSTIASGIFSRPLHIWWTGRGLIVADQAMSPHLSVLSQSGKLMGGCLAHGSGDGRALDISGFAPTVASGSEYLAFDYRLAQAFTVRVDERGCQGNGNQVVRSKGNEQIMSLVNVHSDTMLAVGLFADAAAKWLRPGTGVFADLAVRPPFDSTDIPGARARGAANEAHAAASPTGSSLGIAFRHRSLIYLIDRATNSARVVQLLPVTVPRYTLTRNRSRFRFSDSTELSVVGVAASSGYFYALLCRCRMGDRSLPRFVVRLAWGGTSTELLELPRPVVNIAVDPQDHWIFAVDGERTTAVYRWALPRPDAETRQVR